MTLTRCLMFLADGARADVMNELVAAGELPHIARHIVARGSAVRGVTAFPSTTGPAYLPFLTGCLPATCQVPGIRWFDKQLYGNGQRAKGRRSYCGIETFRLNHDMPPSLATLFRLFPRSYSIFNLVSRGTRGAGNRTRIARIWYWYYAHLTDRWGIVDAAATTKVLDVVARDFQFAFVVFPGIDEYAHVTDPRHPRVLEAYRAVDRAVGLVAERLHRMRRYDETLLWIVSDHGLSSTHTHFCVNTWLERRGLRTLFYPLIYKRKCVVANMMSGNGMTHLYFRHPEGWIHPVDGECIERMSPGLHAALLAEPAVDLVATRERDGWIAVQSRRGRGRLRLEAAAAGGREECLRYEVAAGDPFGYPSLPAILSSRAALQQTIDTTYPDGPYQLAHLFTASRTGDIAVSATPGYDLRDQYEMPEHKATHGSLHREHMHVPILCSAPLPAHPLRTVDVFPLTLQALGHAIPAGIDGAT